VKLWIVPALLAALVAAGCTGGGEDVDPGTAADRLTAAAETLGGAERLEFSIAVDGSLPSGVQGLESAKGFGNRTPAFDGEVTIATGGTSLSAEVVSVDGTVWAKLGFSPDFFTIAPADYGAPDPALLIGTPGEGIVALLADVEVAETSQERDGSTVLTAITGTVPGELVAALIPSTDPATDVEVVVRLTDDDEVQDVTLTGAFYPDADPVTYVVTVSSSTESPTIEAPTRTGGP